MKSTLDTDFPNFYRLPDFYKLWQHFSKFAAPANLSSGTETDFLADLQAKRKYILEYNIHNNAFCNTYAYLRCNLFLF